MTNSEQTTLRRQRYKDRIVQVMGGKCQCCGYTIRKWCKAYNLPYRKADIINFSTEDWDNL